jgi:hypothetical protein
MTSMVLPASRLIPAVVVLCSFGVPLAAPAAPGPPGALVVTDPSSVNVCERVPGAEVAKALGKALRSERSVIVKDSKLSRCVYILGPAGKPDGATEGLVLWLYAPNEYAELNQVTEGKLEPVPGLGDEAVRFLDPGDGRHKVRLLRRGRFSLEASAADAPSSLALARLALERFDR